MDDAVPQSLRRLIEDFEQLPGIGPRSAERYAYYLLRQDRSKAETLAQSLKELHKNVHSCPITFALIENGQKVSPPSSNPKSDNSVVGVVADPFDIVALEKTASFNGTYHVLGGLISPIEGVGPEQLHIAELLSRLKRDKVKELILATNASVEGES